jgi:cellulose biosynthesis protein BcsQ
MKVLASYSIKGGVGKTTASANLAWLAARDGQRVLLWDLDPQGGATYLFRVRPKVKGGGKAIVRGRRELMDAVKASDFDNLDLLPADFSYRRLDLWLDAEKRPTRRLGQLLGDMTRDYDLVVLDCAPSVSLVSENIVRAADLLLAPVLPSPLSLRTLDQLDRFTARTKGKAPQVLAFLSMVDRRRRLHRDVVDEFPNGRADVAKTVIPAASAVEQMGVRRAPLVQWAPRSAAGRADADLWHEVAVRLQ